MRTYLAVLLAAGLVAVSSGFFLRPRIPTFGDIQQVTQGFGDRAREDITGAVSTGMGVAQGIQKQWLGNPSIKDLPGNIKSSFDLTQDAAKGVLQKTKENAIQDAKQIGGLFKPKTQPQPAPEPAAPAPAPEAAAPAPAPESAAPAPAPESAAPAPAPAPEPAAPAAAAPETAAPAPEPAAPAPEPAAPAAPAPEPAAAAAPEPAAPAAPAPAEPAAPAA